MIFLRLAPMARTLLAVRREPSGEVPEAPAVPNTAARG